LCAYSLSNMSHLITKEQLIKQIRHAGDIKHFVSVHGQQALKDWRERKGGNLLHHLATVNATEDATKAAIDAGVDINHVRPYDKNTPLHLATYPKNYASGVVQALVNAGARRDVVNKYGEVPVLRGELSVYERAILPEAKSMQLFSSRRPDVVIDDKILKCLVQQCYPNSCGVASLSVAACYLFNRRFEQQTICSKYARQCLPVAGKTGQGLSYGEFPAVAEQFAHDNGLPMRIHMHPGEHNVDRFLNNFIPMLAQHFPPMGSDFDSTDSDSLILVNYWRIVDGEISGHWSPIAGVWWQPSPSLNKVAIKTIDPSQTYVLIADTQGKKLPPHWIPLRLLAERTSSWISRSRSYRGYVVLSNANPRISKKKPLLPPPPPPSAHAKQQEKSSRSTAGGGNLSKTKRLRKRRTKTRKISKKKHTTQRR
jgi:hypothetical protein